MRDNEELEQGSNNIVDEKGWTNDDTIEANETDEESVPILVAESVDIENTEEFTSEVASSLPNGDVADNNDPTTPGEEPEGRGTTKDKTVNFHQGCTDRLAELDGNNNTTQDRLEAIKEAVQDFFNMRNIHFLFGSGTSAVAIPTMNVMHAKVKEEIEKEGREHLKSEFENISKRIKSKNNLEEILGVLYSHRSYLGLFETKDDMDVSSEVKEDTKEKPIDEGKICSQLIGLVEEVIFESINIDLFKGEDFDTLDSKSKDNLSLYQEFYRKLALRNKDLARLNIFTTNNDLYNEYALDSLNIHYISGFSGGINKFFNPALFNYNFSKRMDTSIEKFEPVENMVYLYKIHGSINWIEDEQNANTFFNIKEVSSISQRVEDKNVLIYPAPTKQNKSLGSPYVEMFREFQKKLLEPHGVLFVIGYSFSDEHVNNVIYQALATNSTINVVILNDVSETKIGKVDDNRIFKIWGEFQLLGEEKEVKKNQKSSEEVEVEEPTVKTDSKIIKIHYFDYFVKELIPNLDAFKKEDDVLGKFLKKIKAIEKEEANDLKSISKLEN